MVLLRGVHPRLCDCKGLPWRAARRVLPTSVEQDDRHGEMVLGHAQGLDTMACKPPSSPMPIAGFSIGDVNPTYFLMCKMNFCVSLIFLNLLSFHIIKMVTWRGDKIPMETSVGSCLISL